MTANLTTSDLVETDSSKPTDSRGVDERLTQAGGAGESNMRRCVVSTPATLSDATTVKPGDERVVSVDALRGFDMFWILGATSIVYGLEGMGDNTVVRTLSTQLSHVTWEGFRFYDLIFPLFLFLVGVSTAFSLDRQIERGSRAQVAWRIVRRSLLLYTLGVLFYGGLTNAWPDVQLGGVLQRIAICYLVSALIYCCTRSDRGLAIAATVFLLSYWALVACVPFPDLLLDRPTVDGIAKQIGSNAPSDIAQAVTQHVRGVYEEGRNLVNFIDFLYLPGKKAQRYYINDGLLSTLPAIALPLFGAIAGRLLKNTQLPPRRKVLYLLGAGTAGVALGLLWSFELPIIKRIWTSSFVVLATGLSALLMAVFYYVVDMKQWRLWCRPFIWIGSNAITLYLVARLVSFEGLAARFLGGDVKRFLDTHVATGCGTLAIALGGLLLIVLFARFLYQRKIFLRV